MESLTPTDEVIVPLLNGFKIRSGWIDKDDPNMLPAGDYIAVESADGVVVFYVDAADLFADPVTGRQKLNEMFQACVRPTPAWITDMFDAIAHAPLGGPVHVLDNCDGVLITDKPVAFFAHAETGYSSDVLNRGGVPGGRQQVVGEGGRFTGCADGAGDTGGQSAGQMPTV